ncbi:MULTISPECIES: hypothetical protein [Bifidobacterium]|uniref:hypothetical protein n=1 Tax=Bifidobacterium TaxID=1678 RepID=UPI001BDBCE17|nr:MULTISPECIES: hypothetical protein [Bifidobacterium]MBT1161870.1 hypothetical protein [Bifidobacterium sp. SO1]MBW3079424.1 hypothetical protein [Bifidobacterium simiiventris]
MVDDDKLGSAGANGSNEAAPGILTAEQQDAVAALAATNKYAKQSKWQTFKELPKDEKWPFFVQHFLLGTSAAVVGTIVVIALIVTFVTKPPEPELAIAGFDLDDYSTQLDELKSGFVKQEQISDDRLVTIAGTYDISGDGYTDDSAKVMTMVTAGDINMMIANKNTFASLVSRGVIGKVSDSETKAIMSDLAQSGALVDKKGEPTDDVAKAYGLNLSKSKTWIAIDGLPDDAIVGISNVVNDTNKTRARQFIDYLKFE